MAVSKSSPITLGDVFAHSIPFHRDDAAAILGGIPAQSGVFALYPPGPEQGGQAAEPYISKASNLRRRLLRLLSPPEFQSRRLNLSERVARIDYTASGSDFESTLLLYRASTAAFGERARKRLRLFPPSCIRLDAANRYPRAYVSNRISSRALDCLYGPFPSRAAAEHYLDESLNFFKLRRCHMELDPDPAYPGCVYSEMKMCLAPCFKGCTDEVYASEAAAVQRYLETRGASLLDLIAARREAASAALEFELAATLHSQFQKAKSVAQQAAEIVRPLNRLDAVLLQPASVRQEQIAHDRESPAMTDSVAVYLIRAGVLHGPAHYSVAGMRHANEASGSSSLFAHPVALEAVPLGTPAAALLKRSVLEQRLLDLLGTLEPVSQSGYARPSAAVLADHLALLKRWYYRPQAQRIGEIFFPNADGSFPLQRILRGISRVYLGKASAAAETPEATAESALTEPGPRTSSAL